MSEADKIAVRSVLLSMYKLSKELSESNEPILWELGHYLVDNLLSKICIYDAIYEKNSINLIYKNLNTKRTKDFPDLYKDILQPFYPNVPDYNAFVDSHHGRRNIFQHSEDSLDLSIRKQFVEPYLSLVEGIMRIIGMIDGTTDLEPSNFLQKSLDLSSKTEQAKVIPESLDPNDDRIDMLKIIIDNLVIHHYTPEVVHEENSLIRRTMLILSNYNQAFIGEYLRSSGDRPDYRRIIGNRFRLNLNEFVDRINRGEIESHRIKRKKMTYAGDLALVLCKKYEEIPLNQHIKVEIIRQDYEHELRKFEYFQEDYTMQPFFDALRILEDDYKLIKQLGEEFKGSDSPTELKILDSSNLDKFTKHFSINYYLGKIFS